MSTNYPTNIDSYTTLVDNVDNVIASHVNNKGDAINRLEQKLGVKDSASPSFTEGGVTDFVVDYFLKNASGAYRTHIHDGSSDDGAKVSVSNLADVTISSLANQQYLRYNSSSGKWENYTMTMTFLILTDTPSSYSGQAGKAARVNTGETAMEFAFPNATYSA